MIKTIILRNKTNNLLLVLKLHTNFTSHLHVTFELLQSKEWVQQMFMFSRNPSKSINRESRIGQYFDLNYIFYGLEYHLYNEY